MSEVKICAECPSISTWSSTGFGADSLRVKQLFTQELGGFRSAETLGRMDDMLLSLRAVSLKCSKEGWDGYDARPISTDVLIDAARLIRRLPLTVPMPQIDPEPSGRIALEWYRAPRRIFIASVSDKNEISYAGLFGNNETHGTEYFGEFLPPVIMANVRRLFED